VGAGDVYGQAVSHGVASGMGGIRTAGDLVARMQITRGMRLPEAKQHVASRLGIEQLELSDSVTMLELRKEFGLGASLEGGEVTTVGEPIGIEAKFHIAELLEVPIASVDRFRDLTAPRRAPAR
jgi:dimethylamine---corrinoid protein Co-methyltransferase